jgi:hypothetical protein
MPSGERGSVAHMDVDETTMAHRATTAARRRHEESTGMQEVRLGVGYSWQVLGYDPARQLAQVLADAHPELLVTVTSGWATERVPARGGG